MNNINTQKNFKLNKLAVIVAGTTAVFLAIVKFVAGIFSGSVSVLSSAIDSMLDCLVSALNFFALKKSSDAPNSKFNFGYGKLEALSSLFEGVLIVCVGLYIFYESGRKFFIKDENLSVDIGLYVMVFSLFITGLLIFFLNKISLITNNLILKADALHYKSDFYSNLAVVTALIIIKLTGFVLIDAILGVIVSLYIIYSALSLVKDGVYILLDGSLEPHVISKVVQIILSKPEVSSFHYLKSRKSGNYNILSYHIVFNEKISLFKAHKISDEIIYEIKTTFNDRLWQITPELDPIDDSDDENIHMVDRYTIKDEKQKEIK